MAEETWKDIQGFEGLYQISSEGNVKSLERDEMVKGRRRHRKERLLKPSIQKHGHKLVVLCKEGETYPKSIHRLVAEAFIPNPEGKPVVDHIDTDAGNNRVENLRWVTQKENCNNPLSRKHGSQAKKGHPYWGKPLSKEAREKISKANKGRVFTPEHREKLRQARLGKKQTLEHIKNAADAKRGKHLSEDTKRKISNSHKGLLAGKHWKLEGGIRVWY